MRTIDFTHPLWAAVDERAQAEIDRLKNELTKPHDHDKTTALRGRIAALSDLLNWPEQDKPNQPDQGIEFL